MSSGGCHACFGLDDAARFDSDVYLSTLGTGTAGTFGPGLYLDGSLFGLSSYDVDAFDMQP